jgi:C-terminal processing protease CtpA/Prc
VGFLALYSPTEFSVPGEITTGFYISFRQPIRLVRDVLPGLAPAKAGMSSGDRVLAIDGRDASKVSFESWDRLLRVRRSVVIRWEHDDHTFSRTFAVVELR